MLIRDKLKPKTPIRSSAPTLDELALLAMQGGSSPFLVDDFGVQSAIGNPDSFPIRALDKSTDEPVVGISGARQANRIERSVDRSLPLGGTVLPSLDESALLLRNQISETDDPVSKALMNNLEQENLANSPSANGPRPTSEPMGGFIATAQGPSRSREAERPKTTLELDKRSAACEQLITLVYNLQVQIHEREKNIQAAEAQIEDYQTQLKRLADERNELLVSVPDGIGKRKRKEKAEEVKDAADRVGLAARLRRLEQIEGEIEELERLIGQEKANVQELKRQQSMTKRNLSEKREELGRLDCKYSPAEVDHIPER